jgi:hypothetical protein
MDTALPLPYVEGIMAVLGLLSLLFNTIFITIHFVLKTVKKSKLIPGWIVWFNFIILTVQVYWLIIDKR